MVELEGLIILLVLELLRVMAKAKGPGGLCCEVLLVLGGGEISTAFPAGMVD